MDRDAHKWIAEELLAQELGVERSVVRAHRPYVEAGMVTQSGRTVLWQKSAAVCLAQKLGLNTSQPEKTHPAATGERVTVVSMGQSALNGRHFGNDRLIRARRANGACVVVRVADSKKYAPRLRNGQPMTLLARPADAGNWWVPVGREPRWPGVW